MFSDYQLIFYIMIPFLYQIGVNYCWCALDICSGFSFWSAQRGHLPWSPGQHDSAVFCRLFWRCWMWRTTNLLPQLHRKLLLVSKDAANRSIPYSAIHQPKCTKDSRERNIRGDAARRRRWLFPAGATFHRKPSRFSGATGGNKWKR